MALQRLIRYYSRKLKNKPTSPTPGDDLAIPDLVLSYRANLKLGEPLEFELLNIPDADGAPDYRVRLILRDQTGKELSGFPVETISGGKLQAITYTVASEQLASTPIILPELEITSADGKIHRFADLQYVDIHPTMCYNYKVVRQPLRDLLHPENISFKAEKDRDGSYKINAALDAKEPLASVEVVDNGSEVYAVDRNHEFDRETNEIFVGTLSTRKAQWAPFVIKITHCTGWKFRAWEAPNVNFGTWRQTGDGITGNTFIWGAIGRFILTVPRNQSNNAGMELELAGQHYSCKLSDLTRCGKIAVANAQWRLDLEKFNKLPDLPVHIDRQEVSFSANVVSDFRRPVFQLRAVGKSGKIYRSRPLCPETTGNEITKLNIFSETAGKVVGVNVPTASIPDLHYVFNPEQGAMLRSNYEPFYDAQLGGGFVYSEAMSLFPLPVGRDYAPDWVKDNNAWVLQFDGKADYLNVTREVFPRGAFTLEFELKPESAAPQVLFRHFDYILGSISLYLKDGKLCAVYGDNTVKTSRIDTDLAVPVGIWTKVKIVYDLKQMVFEANGKQYSCAFDRRPLYFKSAIFGGHTKKEFGLGEETQFFKGRLKSLHIAHHSTPAK